MLITRTPLRVSMSGGGSDYPAFVAEHGGQVIGGAIACYSYFHVRKLPPIFPHKTRLIYSEIEEVKEHSSIKHRAIKACLEEAGWPDDVGLEIFHCADLPSRCGIGSSSTFVVGLLHSLFALQGKFLSTPELRDRAIRVEQDRMGEVVGSQDQTFASHGGLCRITFHRSGQITVSPLPLGRQAIEDLQAHLLLFYLGGRTGTGSDVAASYAGSLTQKAKEQFALMALVDEMGAALEGQDWHRVGEILDRGWRIKRSLSPNISSTKIDEVYATARLAGAWGGKLLGAGGGGMILLAAPPESHAFIERELGCLRVPLRFDFSGSVVLHSESL